MGRDNISGYESGKVLPGSKHLKKLADALGIDANSLIEGVILREEPDKPMLEIKQHGDDPDVVVMRFVQIIPMSTAMEIMQLLKEKK
jgi:transcriptional regulator with XRE-family HTH domain